MKKRLLIVDDQDFVRSLLGMLFQDLGFEVSTAGDAGQALHEALASPPDAVLLDVMMPDVDGWQALAALRGDARTARVPVVMMSAAEDPRNVRRALEADALFLPKPFGLRAVIETVQSLVHKGGSAAA